MKLLDWSCLYGNEKEVENIKELLDAKIFKQPGANERLRRCIRMCCVMHLAWNPVASSDWPRVTQTRCRSCTSPSVSPQLDIRARWEVLACNLPSEAQGFVSRRFDELLILRRFGEENVLVLLSMQNDILNLRQELRKINAECDKDPVLANRRKNTLFSPPGDANRYRQMRMRIIKLLRPLLQEYNEYLCTYAKVLELRPSQRYQLESLSHWHHNHKFAIEPSELYHVETGRQMDYDLVSLGRRPKSSLMKLLEQFSVITWLFRKRPYKGSQVLDAHTESWSHHKIEAFSNIISIVAGLCVLYGPLWWLNWVSDPVHRLAIITGFTFVSAMSLALLGRGKPFEVLAATAAYAAVLMVFFQSNGGSGSQGST